MNITRGKVRKAQKVIVYGPEGIGKTTLASQFPNPLFIDIEGGTYHIDVARTDRPLSWSELSAQISSFIRDPMGYKTLVIDSADWAETLCMQYICSQNQKSSVEDFGFGKGYTYVAEQYGKFLNRLNDVIDKGINVVVTAHAKQQKIEEPNQDGSYDHWTLKLTKGTNQCPKGSASLLAEWADMMLFLNYKTYVTKADKKDGGKVRTSDGGRVMYTEHTSRWDAKNREHLPPELPVDFSVIAHCIPSDLTVVAPVSPPVPESAPVPPSEAQQSAAARLDEILDEASAPAKPNVEESNAVKTAPVPPVEPPAQREIPEALRRLMDANGVTEHDIQVAVANNNYYPADMPVADYDDDFIQGKLIAGWDSFYQAVLYFKNLPYSGE